MENYSIEHVWQVWDNNHGERIEIGEDGDGLGLVQIRQKDETGKVIRELVMKDEEAKLVATSIFEHLEYKAKNKVVF